MRPITIDSAVFTRGVEDIITREELSLRLKEGRQLRIKHGIDATGELHIGHAVCLWKIRKLQELGHKAVILLGDITTGIGDPTGKSRARPVLSAAEIARNLKSIKKGVGKILITDPRVLEFRKSSEWYGKMKMTGFLNLLSQVTHARLIERDMFRKRIAEGSEIFMHELVYPVLQGYDSVALKSDLTVIGSDQLFNEHMGRFFQERLGQRPQVIVACRILPGLDGGEKMSKTLGNSINIEDSPEEKFGKAMRLLDTLIVPYLEIYTDLSGDEIEKVKETLARGGNPRDGKLIFAEALVARYHGTKKARDAKEKFLRLFSKKELSDIPRVKLAAGSYPILDMLVKLRLAPSRSQGRRLIAQGAVEADGKIIRRYDEILKMEKEITIRVGKRKFVKVLSQ